MGRQSRKCIHATTDREGGFRLNGHDICGSGSRDARFVTRMQRRAGKRQIESQLMAMGEY